MDPPIVTWPVLYTNRGLITRINGGANGNVDGNVMCKVICSYERKVKLWKFGSDRSNQTYDFHFLHIFRKWFWFIKIEKPQLPVINIIVEWFHWIALRNTRQFKIRSSIWHVSTNLLLGLAFQQMCQLRVQSFCCFARAVLRHQSTTVRSLRFLRHELLNTC